MQVRLWYDACPSPPPCNWHSTIHDVLNYTFIRIAKLNSIFFFHFAVVDNDDTSTVRYNQGSLKNVDPNQSIGFEIITKNLVAYGAASSRSSFQDQDEVIYDEELDEVIYDEELDEVIYDDPEELFYNKRYIPSNLDQPGTRPESDIYDDIL